MKTLVLVNTLQSVSPFIYSNHIQFFTKTKSLCPEDELVLFTPPRMSIDRARNTAAKVALEQEFDYLLFLDDDVLVPWDAYVKLKSHDLDICAGLVIIRGYPFNVMAFKEESQAIGNSIIDNGQIKNLTYFNDLPLNGDGTLKTLVTQEDGLGAVGFSLCLIKTDLLKAMIPPYFVTGKTNTEDVYFCCKALSELDPVPTIGMDTSIQCGHLLHPEPIEYGTREKMQAFYKEVSTQFDPEKDLKRDLPFLERMLANLK